jgi:hypothetical protein
VVYILLNRYLRLYYSNYGNSIMKILSYVPILWIIPLFDILVHGNEKKTEG